MRPMARVVSRLGSVVSRGGASFSFVALAAATLFFAASLSPSLLPRHFAVQGVLSGLALAVGYGVGAALVGLWRYLEIPPPSPRVQRPGKGLTALAVAFVAGLFLWRATIWQNSIRERMAMPPVETAYPWRMALIALATAAALLAGTAALAYGWGLVHRRVSALAPRRVSYVVSTLIVLTGLFLLANHVIARLALDAADAVFLQLDRVVDEGLARPADPSASGSEASLVDWDSIGRWGKEFVNRGPSQEAISEFLGREARRPLRIYVGLGSRDTPARRAQLALEELQRVGGFDRSVLVVATPTGTGWLDPGAVDTLEYLHAGDTAIVSMQYSYLPSWLTILIDPDRSRDSAHALFDAVYGHWKTLPRDRRPRLYVHGLSLGALGSAASADLFTIFEDPIQGGLWSGPPFPSAVWARATRYRNPDTPMWLPEFRDGSMLRFTGRQCALDDPPRRWGPMRFVYLQHASDPMTFFSPDLGYRRPAWLDPPRGPDVSPYLHWYPIVTFLQVGFDLPMATAVPMGYGHNYAPSSYIDAWIAVTAPPEWSGELTQRLKERFPDRPPP